MSDRTAGMEEFRELVPCTSLLGDTRSESVSDVTLIEYATWKTG